MLIQNFKRGNFEKKIDLKWSSNIFCQQHTYHFNEPSFESVLHTCIRHVHSRVSRGNETNVKTQLFRREENKRLVSFCRGMFTLLTNLSVPRRNETNHNFIVISFIPSWNVFVCEENKRSMREWKQSGLS